VLQRAQSLCDIGFVPRFQGLVLPEKLFLCDAQKVLDFKSRIVRIANVAVHNEWFECLRRPKFFEKEQFMFTLPEQYSTAAKANLESQLSIYTALTSKAFEGFGKIVDLNLNVAKAALEDSLTSGKQLASAKDPQACLSSAAALAQPAAAKAIAYSRELAGIVSAVQAEFARTAEEQFAEAGRKVSALVDDVAKNAPAGSENVVALMKTAIGNANAGYEQFSKTTKQAVEVIEANVNSAVGQFSQAAEKTASRARK
jgi:phasin family protein